MSRFSSFSLAVVLSLASAAPALAETNRPTPASQTAVSQTRAEEPLAAGSARIYYWLATHPDRDAYTGQLTPAAKLVLNRGPKALLAESRRESGLDDNGSASIGSNRSAFAALSTNLKQRQLAARKNVVLASGKKSRHTVDM
jgi:hypothetical protein